MKCLRYPLIITLLAVAALLANPVQAQNRPNRPDNPLLYEVLERLRQLEQELRQLRGDFEFLQYRLERQEPGTTPRSDSADYDDLERRLAALERRLSAATASAPAAPITTLRPQPPAPLRPEDLQTSSPLATVAQPPPVEEAAMPLTPAPQNAPAQAETDAYNLALSRLRAGRYQQAADNFQAFLDDHPSSALASDSYYWLGEAYYAERDFEPAKQAFLTLGTDYPDSAKLPDALLKLGYIYNELGDPAKARQVLAKLREAFPEHPAAKLAEDQLRALR